MNRSSIINFQRASSALIPTFWSQTLTPLSASYFLEAGLMETQMPAMDGIRFSIFNIGPIGSPTPWDSRSYAAQHDCERCRGTWPQMVDLQG